MPQPLKPEQRDALRQSLLQRQRSLSLALNSHQDGQTRADHAAEVLAQDGDDAPQRDADREVDLARSDLATVELAQIERALQHLDQPGFGHCSDCGEAIAPARLQVEPWAQRCIPCQSAVEAQHGGTPHHRL